MTCLVLLRGAVKCNYSSLFCLSLQNFPPQEDRTDISTPTFSAPPTFSALPYFACVRGPGLQSLDRQSPLSVRLQQSTVSFQANALNDLPPDVTSAPSLSLVFHFV